MFLPGALQGVEASFLADEIVRKLRTAVYRVVWSSRQPLDSAGAVLCLLDGPTGCDPAYCVWFGSGFGCFMGIWPVGLRKFLWVYQLIGSAAEGCPGHGQCAFAC